MKNDELNQLIKVAHEAAFFIRSIDGYKNSKIANELSSLAEKVESQKLFAIGRLAARVVYRNNKKAVEHTLVVDGAKYCPPQFHFFVERICAHCGYDDRPATKA